MTPRLTGRTLNLARVLTARGPLRALARRQAMREHGLDRLAALPIEVRLAYDADARPHAGAPPRTWNDAALPAPTPRAETTTSLAAAYGRRERTPDEVFARLRARIEEGAWGEALHTPYIALDLERAAHEAADSTARHAAGTPRSPLDGVPVCVKDHHDVAGLPTRGGTAFLDTVATTDSVLVARLRAAGAILYGKTHLTEWGLSPLGTSPHVTMPHNPYDRRFGAGGSSTGTAVAIALGHAPAGIGSDGGGSVRIPAAICGITGLKPTFLRIGRTGDLWSAGTCGTNGVLGASTADCAELLAAASGRDDGDPATWAAPSGDPASSWRQALGRGVHGCRIGVWRAAFARAAAPIADAGLAALEALARDGAVLEDVDVPLADHHLALGVIAIGAETAGFLADVLAVHGRATGADVRLQVQLLQTLRVDEYLLACRTRAGLRRQMAAMFAGYDLIAAPTTEITAPRYTPAEDGLAVLDGAAVRALTRPNFLANLTGLPAGSVPVGMHEGLPIGLQLVGDAWDEASVIAAMAHCERAGITAIASPGGDRAS